MTEELYTTRSRRTDFRTRAEGEDMVIEGYFVVFDVPYYVNDDFEEVIARDAFEGCDMDDVRALVDHQTHLVLGRNTANTLDIQIDDIGLYGTIRVNSRDGDAVNLHARVQRGDVSNASFGFTEREWTYEDLPGGRIRRTVGKIAKLWEVSVCTFPAYEQTYVSARARGADADKKALVQSKKKKIERKLRHHA